MQQAIRTAFVAFALILVGTPVPSAAQPAPYEINVILPLTGGAAFVGQANLETLHIEEKTVNASGGIHGRPVRFVVQDDQSNPTVDVQLTAGLIAKHVNAIIQGGLAASCRATVPLVSANGPVMYCTSPSYTPQVAGYVFVKLKCEPIPFILGIILGPMFEEYFRRTLLISHGDASVFFTSPLSAFFLTVTVALVIVMLLPAVRRGKSTALDQEV